MGKGERADESVIEEAHRQQRARATVAMAEAEKRIAVDREGATQRSELTEANRAQIEGADLSQALRQSQTQEFLVRTVSVRRDRSGRWIVCSDRQWGPALAERARAKQALSLGARRVRASRLQSRCRPVSGVAHRCRCVYRRVVSAPPFSCVLSLPVLACRQRSATPLLRSQSIRFTARHDEQSRATSEHNSSSGSDTRQGAAAKRSPAHSEEQRDTDH